MMPISILVLCFGGVGLALIVASVARRARKTRTACFDSREMLSIGQWCSAYFPNLSQQTVAECLATISRITGIDAGRLRPTDRFDAELKLPRGNFIAGEWDDVEDQIAKRCQHVQREAKVLTIGDYIELMGASR